MRTNRLILSGIASLLAITLVTSAVAQDATPTATPTPEATAAPLNLAELSAALTARCPCDGSIAESKGRCVSKLSQFKKNLQNLDFFALIDPAEKEAMHSAVAAQKKLCQSQKSGKSEKEKKSEREHHHQ